MKADILAVATAVFAESGYSGARMEEIVRRTQTSKRMIYYYFGDKTGLYQSVLERAYARVRHGEEQLDLDPLSPSEAIRRLVEFTFDYHRANPDYVRLIAIENIHDARHLKQSATISGLNLSIIRKLEEVCRRGIASGAFRADIDPVELHWFISACCVFNVSNRATFSHLYGGALFSDSGQDRLRDRLASMVLDAVRGRPDGGP